MEKKEVITVEIPVWGVERTGYTPLTKTWERLSVAETISRQTVAKTADEEIERNKTDYRALTETVMALNWKVWAHATSDREMSRMYEEKYRKAETLAEETLEGEELRYYHKTTD